MHKDQPEILFSIGAICDNQICVIKLEHKVLLFRIFQYSDWARTVTSIPLLFSLNISQNQIFSYTLREEGCGGRKGNAQKTQFLVQILRNAELEFFVRPCLILTHPITRRGEICIFPKT